MITTTSNTFFISDTHFNHDKEFLYKPRGFSSVEEMNEVIIENWNKVVAPNDTVYHLGDIVLSDIEQGIDIIYRLSGKIRLAIGNHDTENKLARFKALGLFDDIQFGYRINYHHKKFLLTHYPQLTGNFDSSKTYSLHGHTHAVSAFCEYDMMYSVGCDAHNCQPVAFEEVIQDINNHKQIIQGQQ